MTAPDDNGKSSIDRGKYVAVWKKQADGNWKVAVDTWNTDLPFPAPPIKKYGRAGPCAVPHALFDLPSSYSFRLIIFYFLFLPCFCGPVTRINLPSSGT